jgi:hypothetical protein
MATRTSSGIRQPLLHEAVEEADCLIQVECGPKLLEVEPEVDHGDRYIRLDADDHGLGSAHERCVGNGPQCPSDEGIDDIKGADVNDQTASTQVADASRKVVAQGHDFAVAEIRLD